MFSDQKFSSSILANSFSLKGSITCKGELQIDGRINGNINGEKVILGPESSMDGTLNADEIVISGKFKGKIKGFLCCFDNIHYFFIELTVNLKTIVLALQG